MAAKEKKRFLTPAAIAGVEDRPFEEVELPEWGGWLRVRAISASAYDDLIEACSVPVLDENGDPRLDESGDVVYELSESMLKPRLVAAALVDHAGEPMFTVEEAEALMNKSVAPVARLFATIERVMGLDVDEKAAKRTFRSGGPGSGGDE